MLLVYVLYNINRLLCNYISWSVTGLTDQAALDLQPGEAIALIGVNKPTDQYNSVY